MADIYDHHMDSDEQAVQRQRHLEALDAIDFEARQIFDHGEDVRQILEAGRVLVRVIESRARLLGLYPPRRVEVVVVKKYEAHEVPPSVPASFLPPRQVKAADDV